jgi:hypothetical protein
MIYSQLDELIKEKEAKLKTFKKAHQEYFKAEDELRKFMKEQDIGKCIATGKIPLKFALNLPSRNFNANSTFKMDVLAYENPISKESELIILPHLKKVEGEEGEEREGEEEGEEEGKEREEMTIKENIIQAINL